MQKYSILRPTKIVLILGHCGTVPPVDVISNKVASAQGLSSHFLHPPTSLLSVRRIRDLLPVFSLSFRGTTNKQTITYFLTKLN